MKISNLDQLINDHKNTSKLLKLLGREMLIFDKGDHCNFDLMQSIIDYMAEYTQTIHHPIENLAYKTLIERNDTYQDVANELQLEHQSLEKLTKEFCIVLEEIVLESILPRDDVSNLGHKFIDDNLTHLAKEEKVIFPALIKILTDKDWELITHSIENQADPLFGDKTKEKYNELYQQIIEA